MLDEAIESRYMNDGNQCLWPYEVEMQKEFVHGKRKSFDFGKLFRHPKLFFPGDPTLFPIQSRTVPHSSSELSAFDFQAHFALWWLY